MNDIYHIEQLKALEAVLTRSELYFYRKVCRWYSTTFHTPLLQVYEITYDHILQQYYEHTFDQMEYNRVYDLAVLDYLPELAEQEEKLNQEFAESLVDEQEQTIRKKEEKVQSLTQGPPKPQAQPNANPQPKGMDLKFEDDGPPE